MKELARAILLEQEDKLTCAACKTRLPEYVDAQVTDTELEGDFSDVELHLQVCPHCAREYRALLDLVTLAYAEETPQPARQPQFDLSFLASESPAPFRWDDLGRLIIEFSAELMEAFRPPPDQLAHAAVKAGEAPRTVCRFALEEADEDLNITITARETRGDPAHCTVSVDVDIPSRGGWPNLAGTQVTLNRGAEALATHVTDAFGKAVFEEVRVDDLPRLIFKITPVSGA